MHMEQVLPRTTPVSWSQRVPLPLLIAAFCLLWATGFSGAKLAVTDCPPLIALTVRFLLTAAVVLGTAPLLGVRFDLGRRDVLVFAVLGIANQAAYLGFGYVGLRSISSGLAALVISANPVLTAVLAAFLLNESMTWRKAAGLVLGVAGVAFVVEHRLAGGADHPIGIAFAVAALVSLVAGTILFKVLAPKGGYWIGNGVQSLAAGLATLPFAASFEHVGDIVPSWRLIGALLWLALVVSIFAYVLWFHMLKTCGATAASAYHFVMPPLGLLLGWSLLGEHVAPADLVGIVPVAIGIWLVTHPATVRGRT